MFGASVTALQESYLWGSRLLTLGSPDTCRALCDLPFQARMEPSYWTLQIWDVSYLGPRA